jgi:hypothetical protein
MKCPNCGGHNPDYRRKCEYCSAVLERPPLDSEQERLRDQLLSMSLSVEDLFTMEEEQDEAEKAEMMARMLASEGRLSEVSLALSDFKFPTSYAPLPGPYPDNLYLTYVFAVQNITSLTQLQALCDQLDLGNAETLPGEALPHKIREALRLSKQYNRLTRVHEWLQALKPKEGLKRPDRRRRRRT